MYIIQVHHYMSLSPQLPRTSCSFSEVNYTLVIENMQGNLKVEINTFPDLPSGEIKESIRLNLKENQEYSLKLRVKAKSQTITSQKHIFSKLVFIYFIYSQLKPCINRVYCSTTSMIVYHDSCKAIHRSI